MGVSARGFLIGVIAAVAACLITSFAELVVQQIQVGYLQLPPVVVGLFVFLLLANKCGKSIRQKFGLSPQELLTIYCMMLFSAMISSRGLLEKILPLLVTPAYFANDSNKWAKLYFPHVKKWMVAFDPSYYHSGRPESVARYFFEGGGGPIPWHQWIGPLAMWGMLSLFIFGAFMCLASILRRQWVDNERLTFPLAQLPLEMVRDDGGKSFFRNPLTWLGFAIPAVVFTVNGLHNWNPNIPQIGLQLEFFRFMNEPYKQMGGLTGTLSFAAIGFFFLLPVEMLFSLWFFFLMTKVQMWTALTYGMEIPWMPLYATPAFIGYQVMGAYFVLCGYYLYVSLPHLKKVWRVVTHKEKMDDSNELLPYRTAVVGLVLCILGSAIWLTAAGMTPWLALMVLVVFIFIVAIVMARSTAEGGLLMTETSFRPADVYRIFAPTSSMGPANMTMLAFMDAGFFHDMRGLILTGFFDALRIADGPQIRRRAFLGVFIVAILLAILIGGAFQIWLPYHGSNGGNSLYGYVYGANNIWGFYDYATPMRAPVAAVGWQAPTFFVVGAVVAAFLAYMRFAFFWWPLHPLGYALSTTWTMIVYWFPCFVAWMLKANVMKFGGMKMYIKARPLFLGMILGEFSMAVIWTLIVWISKAPIAPSFQ